MTGCHCSLRFPSDNHTRPDQTVERFFQVENACQLSVALSRRVINSRLSDFKSGLEICQIDPKRSKKMKLIFLAIFVVAVVHVYGDPGDLL